ncbi:MAG: hypothetical protein KJP11_11225, partial [Gammaproteobacteria bacterium]|nr:hypothetical protein [Gammaproteobacteria bacterium]
LMHSLEIGGFFVDKGVHVFDSIPMDLADIVNEIMDGQTHKIEFVSASAFNGKVTDVYSLPDLNSLDDEAIKQQIKTELLQMAENPPWDASPKNLHELFETRYGKTAAKIYSAIFKKVYDIESVQVEPNAIAQTSMGRMKFLDDEQMIELKHSSEWLESVLAARRMAVGKVDDLVSIYPSDGHAMKGWCDRASKWLEAKGVRICLGEKIESIEENTDGVTMTTSKQKIDADHVIWSNDNVAGLGQALDIDAAEVNEHHYGTPMLFMTMMTRADQIKDFTYLQNFEPDALTYRTAAAGIYSHQNTNGVSFVTSECPVTLNSERWNNADDLIPEVWQEIKDLGIVDEDAELVDSNALRIPSTFKLAKLGYGEQIDRFNQEVASKYDRVLLRNVVPFFRRDIYLDSLKLRSLVE